MYRYCNQSAQHAKHYFNHWHQWPICPGIHKRESEA